MTSYTLGYHEQQPTQPLLNLRADHVIQINIFEFLAFQQEKEAVTALQTFLKQVESNHLQADDTILSSHEALNTDIRAALLRNQCFSWEDYERINKLFCVFNLYFRTKPYQKKDWLVINASVTSTWEAKLYVRYGNVELRVIENWLKDPGQLEHTAVEIIQELGNEAVMYQDGKRPHWLSAADVHFNLRRLMTNAGFYFADQVVLDTKSLDHWASAYFQALAETDYLLPYPGSYPNFWMIQDHLYRQQNSLKNYAQFPGAEKFYAMLAGHNVLFMTAFSEEVAALYDSRKLFNLYSDINIPPFQLSTVPAYISTYPNRPHDSWTDTFEHLKANVDQAFAKESFTIFFASCGCYGLPICHYVYQKYGCASVYYGNFTNTLFGILQNCSQDFLRARRLDDNWSKGNLQQFKNVAKIDNGRYV